MNRTLRSCVLALVLSGCAAEDTLDPVAPTADHPLPPGGLTTPGTTDVSTVLVYPRPGADFMLEPQDTIYFWAAGFDPNGEPVATVFEWSSTNPAAVRIDPATGIAVPVAPGVATIRAKSSNGVAGSSPLVTALPPPGPVVQVSVHRDDITLPIGRFDTLTAVGHDTAGRVSPTTFTWTSSNPGIVMVSPLTATSAIATAVGFGSVTIRATSANGVVSNTGGNITVPVTPVEWVTVQPGSGGVGVGEGMQFTATAFDAAGRVIPATFTWTTGSSTIAGVTSSGWATGRRVGVTTIRATTPNGKVGSVSLQVLRSDL